MNPRLLVLVAAATVALSLAACTAPGAPPQQLGREQAAIINGVLSDAADDSTIALPFFENGQFAGFCSGVLVAPNLVLTARHCVSVTDEYSVCDSDGNQIEGGQVYSDRDATSLAVLVGSKLTFDLPAHGKQIFIPPSDTLCNEDIALVLLDTPITTAPIAQLRLDTPPVGLEKVRSVGWGVANDNLGNVRRRRDNVTILQVGPVDSQTGIGGIGAHEIEVGEAICSGDSGGPAYAETTGAVLGVVSRGGNGLMVDPNTDPPYKACVDSGLNHALNLYTRVDSFPALLQQAFDAAGAEPWHEGGPDPRKAKTGEACDANDACRSDICVDPKHKGYCTQVCDDTPGSCPSPMTCHKAGDVKVCKLPGGGCAMGGADGGAGGAALVLLLATCVAMLRRRRAAA